MNPAEHKIETPRCLHCNKTLDVKAPPTETVCENCCAYGVIKKSETPETDAEDRPYPSPEYAQRIRFEGNECVVMHPEEYEALYEKARELERERDQARRELEVSIEHLKFFDEYGTLNTLKDERDQLRARVVELETKLTALGDLAVADWNDAIVGEVDKLIPSQTQKKYSEVLRDLFVTIPARAKELEKDKERLDWLEKSNGVVNPLSRRLVLYFESDLTPNNLREAIDAAMKGQE